MHETGRQRVKAFVFFGVGSHVVTQAQSGLTISQFQTRTISDLGWEFTISAGISACVVCGGSGLRGGACLSACWWRWGGGKTSVSSRCWLYIVLTTMIPRWGSRAPPLPRFLSVYGFQT